MKPCKLCGKPTSNKTFCSVPCLNRWMTGTPEGQKLICTKERREKTSRFARNRMLTDNPMKREECRLKVSASLKKMGWKPKVRGGNGTGPTKAESLLLSLVNGSVWNYGIKTGKWNGSGFPPMYKVDVAFPELKLAVEADGQTHNSPVKRMQDAKKTAFLQGLGWTVLRFSNRAILEDTEVTKLALMSIISTLKGITPTR